MSETNGYFLSLFCLRPVSTFITFAEISCSHLRSARQLAVNAFSLLTMRLSLPQTSHELSQISAISLKQSGDFTVRSVLYGSFLSDG